jgi:hypothetical protein
MATRPKRTTGAAGAAAAPEREQPTRRGTKPASARWTRVCAYDYRDSDGRCIGRHLRWRLPDGGKAFTYDYREPWGEVVSEKHPRLDALLYRLPELLAAMEPERVHGPQPGPEEPDPWVLGVWWTEGEKDADALVARGLVATSHHGGAGHITAEQCAWFRGYEGHVTLVADNDPHGSGSLDALMRWDGLAREGLPADRVRVVRAATGKDAYDHLAAGHSLAEFVPVEVAELRAAARAVTPADREADGYDLSGWHEARAASKAAKAAKSAATTPTSPARDEDAEERPSWAPVDLEPHLAGTYKPEQSSLLRRTDGLALLYRGKVHSFHGESESGKSWLAQCAVAEVVGSGESALYLDFEDDAPAVVARLLLLGIPPEMLRERFSYVRPEASLKTATERAAFEALLTGRFALAVIDGVTDAMGVFGMKTTDNDDVASFMRDLPRRLADATGAAVVLVDHVTKDKVNRGRMAIGSQHKMAALSGAAYTVEVKQGKPLGQGLHGVAAVRLGKDRPGGLRPHGGVFRSNDRTQALADFHLNGEDEGRLTWWLEPASVAGAPGVGDEDDGVVPRWRPTALMERVSELLEGQKEPLAENTVVRDAGGNAKAARKALARLVEEDYVKREDGPRRSKLHTSLRPYRQADDPDSDQYAPPSLEVS